MKKRQGCRQDGFTLAELMITVVIAAILVSFAAPAYTNQTRTAQRVDAMAGLLTLAATQENYFLQNGTYGSTAEIGDPTTDQGWYTLAVTSADANTFTATATAVAGSPQALDTKCKVFAINALGTKTATDSDGNDNGECWR